MKRRIFDWLSTILERLLLLVDGRAPTKVRIKAVKPAAFAVPVQHVRTQRLSRDRERMKHHCAIPWAQLEATHGSWQCPLCRGVYTYLQLPRKEVTVPQHVVRYHKPYNAAEMFREFVAEKTLVINNRLCYADGTPVITGRLYKPAGWRA